ncbi:MAG: hypothetical protein KKB53_04115, partial [Acidobacteria bacterium]|nr:hypothetical protein [Acidobacteriota bacterium]MCG2817285.1 hypothetical protein [Candidatus Aminicenantes bacterium]
LPDCRLILFNMSSNSLSNRMVRLDVFMSYIVRRLFHPRNSIFEDDRFLSIFSLIQTTQNHVRHSPDFT